MSTKPSEGWAPVDAMGQLWHYDGGLGTLLIQGTVLGQRVYEARYRSEGSIDATMATDDKAEAVRFAVTGILEGDPVVLEAAPLAAPLEAPVLEVEASVLVEVI